MNPIRQFIKPSINHHLSTINQNQMPETLYLIDAYAQIFRAYYAIRGGMRSPVTSEPTHAVFGFTGMLLKLFSQFHPHYVVVAVDAPGPTFREDLYSLYADLRQPGASLPELALLPPLEIGQPPAITDEVDAHAVARTPALAEGETPTMLPVKTAE